MLTFTVSILVNTKTQRMQRNTYSAVFICKGEKIANAGYLEKKNADFCESYNLYLVEWVSLITPGYPRSPKVTPKYSRTHLISYIIYLFIQTKTKQNRHLLFFHFKSIASKKVLLNIAETI